MACTAAWSAALASPWPMVRVEAMAAASTTWTKSPSRSRSMLTVVAAKVGALIKWRCPSYQIPGRLASFLSQFLRTISVVRTGDLGDTPAHLSVSIAHANYFGTRKGHERHAARRLAELPGLLLNFVLGFTGFAKGPPQGHDHGFLIHALDRFLFLDGLLHLRRKGVDVILGGAVLLEVQHRREQFLQFSGGDVADRILEPDH